MSRTWPAYQTLRPLIHAHVGRAAVVMGGGPSLLTSIHTAPEGAIYISANDHGCRYFEAHAGETRVVSYIVALDRIEHRIRKYPQPVISRHMYADYRLLFSPTKSSGMAGAFLARLMGCAPILLAGMDCYAGGTYFDDPKARSSGKYMDAGTHATQWRELMEKYPAQYRVIGGDVRVRNLLGNYDPSEPLLAVAAREQLEKEIEGTVVKLTRASCISMRDFPVGEVLELNKNEADRFLKLRQAVRVRA